MWSHLHRDTPRRAWGSIAMPCAVAAVAYITTANQMESTAACEAAVSSSSSSSAAASSSLSPLPIAVSAVALSPSRSSPYSASVSSSSSLSASLPSSPAASSGPTLVSKPDSSKKKPEMGFKHMLAGSLAGMASRTILQPLDLVKVRLQVQDGTGRNEYKGLYDGVRSILRNDGFYGLYRGLAPNLMASGVSWGVYFFSYNHAKNFWRQYLLSPSSSPSSSDPSSPSPSARLGPFAHLSCAAFSGTLSTVFTNPFSMVKCWGTGTELLMYDGTKKAVEDIVRDSREGRIQVLMGDDSTPRIVQPESEHHGHGELYTISFDKAGRTTWTCNAQHVLVLRTYRKPQARHQYGLSNLWEVTYMALQPGPSDFPDGQRSFVIVEVCKRGFNSPTAANDFIISLNWHMLEFECVLADYLGMSKSCQSACRMFAPSIVKFQQNGVSLRARLTAAVQAHGGPAVEISDELVEETAWIVGMHLIDAENRDPNMTEIGLCRQQSRLLGTAVARRLKHWYSCVNGVDALCAADLCPYDNSIVPLHLNLISRCLHPALAGKSFCAKCDGTLLTSLLDSYGLRSHKHLPHDLLTEPPNVRQALLQGFLNGGGQIQENSCLYTLIIESHDMRVGVEHLVRGLGLSAAILDEEQNHFQHGDKALAQTNRGFCIHIDGAELLSRRVTSPYDGCPATVVNAFRNQDQTDDCEQRAIGFTVMPAGEGAFWGFELDGNRRCLLSDFVITHNTRLQLQGKEVNTGARMYKGVFDAFIRISREEGVLTLYRGIGPSLVLVSNGALQFMSYEELKRLTIAHLIPSHEEKELQAVHFLCMGALAKVFSATVTYPMAVTRARLYQRKPDELLKVLVAADPPVPTPTVVQSVIAPAAASSSSASASLSSPSPASSSVSALPKSTPPKTVDGKYDGMSDVIRKIWRLEGWRGFYRGLTPMLLKTAPSSAITFMIYEKTIKLLHGEPVPKQKKFD